MFYEDFQKNPSAVIEQCCVFLGIDASFRDETAVEPRHVSLGSVVDRPVVTKFRNNAVMSTVFRMFPKSVKNVFKRPFQQVITERPQWTAESLETLLGLLREDSRKILCYTGKPANYWSLQMDAYLR